MWLFECLVVIVVFLVAWWLLYQVLLAQVVTERLVIMADNSTVTVGKKVPVHVTKIQTLAGVDTVVPITDPAVAFSAVPSDAVAFEAGADNQSTFVRGLKAGTVTVTGAADGLTISTVLTVVDAPPVPTFKLAIAVGAEEA